MAKLKTGNMSRDEFAIIVNDFNGNVSMETTALKLNRSVDFVKKAIAQIPKRESIAGQSDIIAQLHASASWTQIQRTLLPNEMSYFEQQWASYVEQFSSGSELVATDEMMIRDLILLDIHATRASSDKKDAMLRINELEKILDKEREKPIDDRNQILMGNIQEQANSLRATLKPLTDVHLDYQKRKDAKLDDLRATRKQRFNELAESKQNFFGLIKELDEFKKRAREGVLAEKVLMAAQNTLKDWNEPVVYDDGTIDKPFLSPEGEEENNDNINTVGLASNGRSNDSGEFKDLGDSPRTTDKEDTSDIST